ncbi:MAG: hypothetical protein WC799_25565 [Desulfobacteraceae bacterium]|jgi:hypothetical protein
MKTKRSLALLFLLPFIMLFNACDEQTGYVQGFISEDGVAISSVSVKIYNKSGTSVYSTKSDSKGIYKIPNADTYPPDLEMTVKYTKAEYYFENNGSKSFVAASHSPDIEGVNLKTTDCYPQSATILSTQDLQAISSYRTIGGNLTIQASSLTNVDSLKNLTKVCGNLTIDSNLSLTSIQGLSALVKIWGNLIVNNNPILQDISCFANLMDVESIRISSDPSLKNLHGLNLNPSIVLTLGLTIDSNSGLETLEGISVPSGTRVKISNNPLLMSLKGLNPPLDDEGMNIDLDANANLASLEGLEGVQAMNILKIQNSPKLTSLLPLSDLKAVTAITIQNTGIINLVGLGNLTTLNGGISINDNPFLVSLEGLSIPEGTPNITIRNDHALTHLTGLTISEGFKGTINLWDLPGITSLAGLSLPVEFAGSLSLFTNAALSSIDLSHVESMDSLTIVQCHALSSLEHGFGSLSSLNTLYMENNKALASIQSFSNLSSMVNLSILNNPALETLEGLDGLESSENIQIDFNENLFTLENLRALKAVNGILNVYHNNSLTILGLDALKTVKGQFVFMDNYELCTTLIEDVKNQLDLASNLSVSTAIIGNKVCD